MALGLFVYSDKVLSAIPAGSSVNVALVVANTQQEADRILDHTYDQGRFLAFDATALTLTKHEPLGAWNKLIGMQGMGDSVTHGNVLEVQEARVLAEFVVSAHA